MGTFDGFDFNLDDESEDTSFDFNIDDSDVGKSEDASGQSGGMDFGDFQSGEDTNTQMAGNTEPDGKKALLKQCAVIGVIALIIAILAISLVRWLSGSKSKPSENNNKQQVVTTQPSGSSTAQQDNGWVAFDNANGLSFKDEYILSRFSITKIQHYAKVSGSNNLEIKTILTGSLSGFDGTFEIEVPYYKGSLLSIGNYFDVSVQVGDLGGKLVVGEIEY